MKCSRVIPYLESYIKGQVSHSLRTKIDEHLANCANCQQTMQEISPIIAMLANDARQQPKFQLSNESRDRLEKVIQEAIAEAKRPRYNLAAPAFVICAGLFIGLLIINYFVSR